MTFRDEAVAAYRAGRGAAVGDVNPYRGKSVAFAQMWRRGYMAMLMERSEATSAMQEYRRAQAEDAKSQADQGDSAP